MEQTFWGFKRGIIFHEKLHHVNVALLHGYGDRTWTATVAIVHVPVLVDFD
jgi:hypothetical protein